MAEQKSTKVLTKRKKFIDVEIPIIRTKIEIIGDSLDQINGRNIKLDLTRQLKGKSIEAVMKVSIENNKAIAHPVKIKLMPYFIRRMIRKRISYVEDSFEVPSQENMILIKPFIITRKRVSRAVRKTLRNKAKNWISDYIAERKNNEIFNELISNRFQKPLSLYLKKTYPLSLCEIRVIEVKRKLNPEEVPEIKPKEKHEKVEERIEEGLDQFAEIEQERIKKAEKEIKETQENAASLESSESKDSELAVQKPKKERKPRKKKEVSEEKTE